MLQLEVLYISFISLALLESETFHLFDYRRQDLQEHGKSHLRTRDCGATKTNSLQLKSLCEGNYHFTPLQKHFVLWGTTLIEPINS